MWILIGGASKNAQTEPNSSLGCNPNMSRQAHNVVTLANADPNGAHGVHHCRHGDRAGLGKGHTSEIATLDGSTPQLCSQGLQRTESSSSMLSQHGPIEWTDAEVQRIRQMVSRQAELAETEQVRLGELQESQPLIVRLGRALQQRNVNMRAIDLLRSWHGHAEGGITMDEFERNIRSWKLVDHPTTDLQRKEIQSLFRLLDEDANGSLGLEDLKPALKQLREAFVDAEKEMATLETHIAALRRRSSHAAELLQVRLWSYTSPIPMRPTWRRASVGTASMQQHTLTHLLRRRFTRQRASRRSSRSGGRSSL
mgnify:CR=1 FL=1|jgi:hypothetical protein